MRGCVCSVFMIEGTLASSFAGMGGGRKKKWKKDIGAISPPVEGSTTAVSYPVEITYLTFTRGIGIFHRRYNKAAANQSCPSSHSGLRFFPLSLFPSFFPSFRPYLALPLPCLALPTEPGWLASQNELYGRDVTAPGWLCWETAI